MASTPTRPVAVSYVMPVLNEAGYLEAAIASEPASDHRAPGMPTELARGYTSRAVAKLISTDAASLGGVMIATGLGGGPYHGEQAAEGPAESAYMGHLSWEAGFVLGVLGGTRDVVDRSRTES